MSSRIIYGVHPVLQALRTSPETVLKIWIAFGRRGPEAHKVVSRAREFDIPVTYKDRRALDRHAGTTNHQGIVALVSERIPLTLREVLETKKTHDLGFLILLDTVQDPHNLGAIIRTADAAGVDAVILPRHRTAPLTPAVAKTSAGALETVPLCRITNVAESIRVLKEKGFWVCGADPEGEITLFEADFRTNVCLVLGGEGKGLRPLVKERCDVRIRIPQWGTVPSLNLSVAAALLLYEVRRQRMSSHL